MTRASERLLTMEGRARRFGDDVNTDYIISSARKRRTIDVRALRPFIFESIAPDFAASVRPGDVVVAGRNFGCGSAMEIAVTGRPAAAATAASSSATRAVAPATDARS